MIHPPFSSTMSTDGTYGLPAGFARRMRRRSLIMRRIVWLAIVMLAFGAVLFSFEVVELCCGEDSLPSQVFLSATVLWALRVGWRYLGQEEERDDYYEDYP
jgi:hypothetical protein